MANWSPGQPCDKCGSSDGFKIDHDDGHGWCFVCEVWTPPEGAGEVPKEAPEDDPGCASDLITGEFNAIPKRRLYEEVCRKYDYRIGTFSGKPCQIATYRDDTGRPVAQKIRLPGKEFTILGNAKKMGLYGQHLWRTGGKTLTITEGEIDCLTMAQAFGLKFPVVSLPNGAAAAVKAIKANYDYVTSYDTVVLMFDSDEPGREAAKAVADILPPGKVKIVQLPRKDANEMAVAGEVQQLVAAWWEAKLYRPDGIVSARSLRGKVVNPKTEPAIPYPWNCLNEKLGGQRMGELVMWTAGSGVGKSTLLREIAYDLRMNHGVRVGMLMLEEGTERTALGLVGIHLNKNLWVHPEQAGPEERAKAFDEVFPDDDALFLYDHFGSSDIDNLCNRIRYMARALGCQVIILDHISIVVSGMDGDDERKMIDRLMTILATLAQELGVCLHVISHLRRPQGDKGHEDGAKVSLGQLRGSHAIAQLSHACIAQEVPEAGSDERRLVLLKNRFSGHIGPCGSVFYDRETGRVSEGEF